MSHSLPGKKRILLGVTGGIAAYKTPDLVRKLIAAGLEVQVVMTDSAQRFVTPLALEVVSGKPVATSLWDQRQSASGSDIPHTEMGRHVDGILIAPATADFLGRTATGLAGDLLGNILLASSCPVLLCPSMNDQMWANPLVQANLNRLLEQPRFKRMEPDTGELACKVVGKGRMPDPERIVENVSRCRRRAPRELSGYSGSDTGIPGPCALSLQSLYRKNGMPSLGNSRERRRWVHSWPNGSGSSIGGAAHSRRIRRGNEQGWPTSVGGCW